MKASHINSSMGSLAKPPAAAAEAAAEEAAEEEEGPSSKTHCNAAVIRAVGRSVRRPPGRK